MPIALGNRIGESEFMRGIGCVPVYDAQTRMEYSCSSSSSIGKDSGSDGQDSSDEKEEVQSQYKGPLDGLHALEESLPIRRGISNFYRGKSKSFTSLADAKVSCASAKDLGKSENAFTRKRRNLLASRSFCVKPTSNLLRSNGGGICKRPPSSSRCTLALAVAMSNSTCREEQQQQQQQQQQHQNHLLPPLHPPGKTNSIDGSSRLSFSPHKHCVPMRSFSLTDLQGIAGSKSSTGPRDKHKIVH